MTTSIGRPGDILAFFRAIELTTEQPEQDFPLLWSLRKRPVFAKQMLPLFEEAAQLQSRLEHIQTTDHILDGLGLLGRETRLDKGSDSLAGVFTKILKILAEDVKEFVQVSEAFSKVNPLEYGSIRFGPTEPLLIRAQFRELPEEYFDEEEPPLWLRDEIFDEDFYIGKI